MVHKLWMRITFNEFIFGSMNLVYASMNLFRSASELMWKKRRIFEFMTPIKHFMAIHQDSNLGNRVNCIIEEVASVYGSYALYSRGSSRWRENQADSMEAICYLCMYDTFVLDMIKITFICDCRRFLCSKVPIRWI